MVLFNLINTTYLKYCINNTMYIKDIKNKLEKYFKGAVEIKAQDHKHLKFYFISTK